MKVKCNTESIIYCSGVIVRQTKEQYVHLIITTHLVLISIVKLCIHHVNETAFVWSHIEAELFLPGPVISTGNSCLDELLHHADVVDNIEDQSLQLQLQDAGLCTGRHTKTQEQQNLLS